MTQPCGGRYVTIRRSQESSAGVQYQVLELRLYQTQNLLQQLEEEGTIEISGPAPKEPKYAVTNLIKHLNSRTSGTNKRPLIDQASKRATYESCFKTSNIELGP